VGFSPNPVRKQVIGSSLFLPTGKVFLRRGWVAVCPRCGKTCKVNANQASRTSSKKRRPLVMLGSTRKQAKDSLHRHQSSKTKHWNGKARTWEPECNPSPPAVVG